MEIPAFKIVKLKWTCGQKYLNGSNPSFQVYGLEGTDFFHQYFILRIYFTKITCENILI